MIAESLVALRAKPPSIAAAEAERLAQNLYGITGLAVPLYDLVRARIATAILVYAWRCRHDMTGAEATAESGVCDPCFIIYFNCL
jgi:hypothetical protein